MTKLRSAAQPLNRFFGLLSDEQEAQINALLGRSVCTYPAKGTVCRDWDTGKLVSARHAQQ